MGINLEFKGLIEHRAIIYIIFWYRYLVLFVNKCLHLFSVRTQWLKRVVDVSLACIVPKLCSP